MDYSAVKGLTSGLFSREYMRSPVSTSALGECNAIKSEGLGHSELTFVVTLETSSGNHAIRRRFVRLTAHQPELYATFLPAITYVGDVGSVPFRSCRGSTRFSSERDSSLRKRWVGANSNPPLWTPDYDLLPNVAIEHPGAFLVHTACRFVYRLEHGSTPIAPDSRGQIRSLAFDRCVRDRAPVRIRGRDKCVQAPMDFILNERSIRCRDQRPCCVELLAMG